MMKNIAKQEIFSGDMLFLDNNNLIYNEKITNSNYHECIGVSYNNYKKGDEVKEIIKIAIDEEALKVRDMPIKTRLSAQK